MKRYEGLEGILLIDDDLPTNFIHKKVIEKAAVNAAVKSITSVQEALDFITYSGIYEDTPQIPRPGLIFLDINMPGLDGWDFMDAYNRLDQRFKARLIIIMLSTSLDPEDKAMAMIDREVVTFLSKPLRPEIVTTILDRYFK
ncbi:Response regulator receiver domain-containing protein [Mucilaginibacter sp. OK268]|uniref:response regulator n=1 Tax=Mucilaginibacter sp. OK268 TaxID=1881048 RepID=UPI0008875741|nr:response regulator [Mucilaginibacter sp. OK268]SDP97122.1 Response regulator receiver domain-containing protein [Mucilaginibacter sp. OK268]